MNKFPFYRQLDAMDCGPSCLRMVAQWYGKTYSLQYLREHSYITRLGVTMLGISDAAESIGFRTNGYRMNFEQLLEVPLPFIAHWNRDHFIVVYKIKKKKDNYKLYVADPANGLLIYSRKDFEKFWFSTEKEGEPQGHLLVLEPTPEFYVHENVEGHKLKISYLLNYLRPYRSYFLQLVLGMLTGSIISLIFPFLTQSIVDVGIGNGNLSFILMVLIAQLFLSIGQTANDLIRSWIMLHITARISISLISDFLQKLMRLPISFFDVKLIGDIMQRIGDHGRIQSFLTGTLISIAFSVITFIVYTFMMSSYHEGILSVFMIGSVLYIGWVLLFMKRRRDLDYMRFQESSANQSNLVQLITGMQEIKLNGCEKQKRWEWERIQARLFKVSIPARKITAIVGVSGSGKTTLIKMLLGFYKPVYGEILLNNVNLDKYSPHQWRMKCGIVMQEGYIFSDTIKKNIGVIDEIPDKAQIKRAAEIANIKDFIDELPMGYDTKIGNDGHGLSSGQKQRILIARAVYKNPEYILFDEATNSLDANNEKIIMEKLNNFFKGKTVIVVAHRLSTVKHADQIIVMEAGQIKEKGTHEELVNRKGAYYNLVKNQLELDA